MTLQTMDVPLGDEVTEPGSRAAFSAQSFRGVVFDRTRLRRVTCDAPIVVVLIGDNGIR